MKLSPTDSTLPSADDIQLALSCCLQPPLSSQPISSVREIDPHQRGTYVFLHEALALTVQNWSSTGTTPR